MEVNWGNASDLVPLINPAVEFVKNRILVAFEKSSVSFTGKVNFAPQVVEIEFQVTQNLDIRESKQSVEEQQEFFFEKDWHH